jgi:hypothetical protein
MEAESRIEKRRSQRVALRVPVTVLGVRAEGNASIYEKAQTLEVNAHGAFLPIKSAVAVGQMLTIRHDKTEEELFCKVARVEHNHSWMHVGLEFLHPSPRFWRISFPPIDWGCPPAI